MLTVYQLPNDSHCLLVIVMAFIIKLVRRHPIICTEEYAFLIWLLALAHNNPKLVWSDMSPSCSVVQRRYHCLAAETILDWCKMMRAACRITRQNCSCRGYTSGNTWQKTNADWHSLEMLLSARDTGRVHVETWYRHMGDLHIIRLHINQVKGHSYILNVNALQLKDFRTDSQLSECLQGFIWQSQHSRCQVRKQGVLTNKIGVGIMARENHAHSMQPSVTSFVSSLLPLTLASKRGWPRTTLLSQMNCYMLKHGVWHLPIYLLGKDMTSCDI